MSRKEGEPIGFGALNGQCFDFRRGRCDRGSRCRFAHVASRGEDSGPCDAGGARRGHWLWGTDGEVGIGEAGTRRRAGDWTCIACGNLNFASRDICHKCKSTSRPGTAKSAASGADPSGACFDFRAGRCTRGSACRFSHEPEPAGAGPSSRPKAAARFRPYERDPHRRRPTAPASGDTPCWLNDGESVAGLADGVLRLVRFVQPTPAEERVRHTQF